MASVFTRIMSGELPGHFVWSDDECAAFLSINPVTTGHTLVVPRAEVDHWLDLEPQVAAHLFEVSGLVGRGIARAFSPARVGLEIAGFEIAHAHVHVLGIDGEADLHLSRSARQVDPDVLVAAATALRSALRALGATGVPDEPG